MKNIIIIFVAILGCFTAIVVADKATRPDVVTRVEKNTRTNTNTLTVEKQITVQSDTAKLKTKPPRGYHRNDGGYLVSNGRAGGAYISGLYAVEEEHVPFRNRTLWCLRDVGDVTTWSCDWYGYHHDAVGKYVK